MQMYLNISFEKHCFGSLNFLDTLKISLFIFATQSLFCILLLFRNKIKGIDTTTLQMSILFNFHVYFCEIQKRNYIKNKQTKKFVKVIGV